MPRGSSLRATRERVAARASVQLTLHYEACVVGVFGRADPLHVLTTFAQTIHRVGGILDSGRPLPGRAYCHANCLSVGGLRRRFHARCVRVRVRVRVHRRRGYRRRRGAHVKGGRVQPLVTHRLVGGHAFLWIPPAGEEEYTLETFLSRVDDV